MLVPTSVKYFDSAIGFISGVPKSMDSLFRILVLILAGTLQFKTLPLGKADWALLPDAHLSGCGLPCLLLP